MSVVTRPRINLAGGIPNQCLSFIAISCGKRVPSIFDSRHLTFWGFAPGKRPERIWSGNNGVPTMWPEPVELGALKKAPSHSGEVGYTSIRRGIGKEVGA